MKGLLLSGGWGTRLRPLTFTGNKHMLPLANKPMLQYGLEHLRNAGITDIGIVLGPMKEGVVQTFGDGSAFDVDITYLDQPEPKGLAHAIMVAEKYLADDAFVMYLGDNLLSQGVQPLVNIFQEGSCDCVIGATHVQEPQRYGVIVFNPDGSIHHLVEKPQRARSHLMLRSIHPGLDS
jgi:glucose-1-phosphate thymidylyltransferase